jgi:hypothetical protein
MPVQAVIAAANYREESLPDEVWIKAAVAGGLWASFEIIIGSFLHNMRIPFAGSLLAVTGMVLMIAFHRLWPERGLIWRAGLICALMKSISPSSLILGPMIGILTEAMLLELSVRLLGTNKAGYITGGVLGVSSAIIHKIASILILYGFSLIEVYLNIYRFAARQFGVENPDPWKLLAALAGVYFAAGLAAGILGLSVPVPEKKLQTNQFPATIQSAEQPFGATGHRFSLTLLLLHLCAIPAFIILTGQTGIATGLAAVAIWCLLISRRYQQVFRRFGKPVLWLQFLIITVFAALFWEVDCDQWICISREGFMAGIAMTLRAIVVITAFSAISIEIRNPVVHGFLTKRGMKGPYLAVTMAFAALPFMISRMPGAMQLIRHPGLSVKQALTDAGELLQKLKTNGIPSA